MCCNFQYTRDQNSFFAPPSLIIVKIKKGGITPSIMPMRAIVKFNLVLNIQLY